MSNVQTICLTICYLVTVVGTVLVLLNKAYKEDKHE